MSHHHATCAVILSSLLLASTASAGTEINKCVSATGAVTLTDEPCPPDTRALRLVSASPDASAAAAPAPDAGARMGIERYASAPLPRRFVPPKRSPAPTRGLTPDVATLKAARANMQLFDLASQRAGRVASFP